LHYVCENAEGKMEVLTLSTQPSRFSIFHAAGTYVNVLYAFFVGRKKAGIHTRGDVDRLILGDVSNDQRVLACILFHQAELD
jgi:hypothetical protein